MTNKPVPQEDRAKIPKMSDIEALHGVEIRVNSTGSTIWVNVDNVCVLRLHPKGNASVSVRDERRRPQSKPLVEPVDQHAKPWDRPEGFRTDKDD